jgi:hypothetical protein
MALVLTWPVGRAADADRRSQAAPARPVLSYLLGSVVGGTATGVLLAAIATALAALPAGDAIRLALAGTLAAVAVVAEARGRVAPLPERRDQVPREWLTWVSRSRTGFAFGVLIGSGAVTYLKHAAAYAIVALAIIAPSPTAAVLVGTVYGAARGGSLVVTWLGDRFVGRRPPEAPVEDRHLPLNLALAALASLSFVVAALPILN